MENNALSKIINDKTLLPNRIFNNNVFSIKAFEPSLIKKTFFFERLLFFLKKSKQKQIIAGELIGDILFTLDVNNLNYNYWIEKVFSIESLFYTETGITSESANWGLFLDNVNFEIGLVGFCDLESKNLFFESFGKDSDIFIPPKNFIANMDSVLNFSSEIKEKYNIIIKNNSFV